MDGFGQARLKLRAANGGDSTAVSPVENEATIVDAPTVDGPTLGARGPARHKLQRSIRARRPAAWLLLAPIGASLAALSLKVRRTEVREAEPTLLTGAPLTASFGVGEGVGFAHPGGKEFEFELNAPLQAVIFLHFQSKDVSPGQLTIQANGLPVGEVPPDGLRSEEFWREVFIPARALKMGEVNRVAFVPVRPTPGQKWRIWNAWVEIALLPQMPLLQLVSEAEGSYRRAQQSFERREIGPGNRYLAWKNARESWLMLEAHPEPRPGLYLLAREKMGEAQLELDRVCSKLMLEFQRHFQLKNLEKAQGTLEQVNSFFPAPDQPCPGLAQRQRSALGL